MHTVERETKAEGFKYPLSFYQFDSMGEAAVEIARLKDEKAKELLAALAPFEEALKPVLGVVNAAQEQGAKQGAKEPIRKSIREHGVESEEVQKEIEEHQKRAAAYIIGAPRGSTGGFTKTKAANLGKAMREKLDDEQLAAVAAELGIDIDAL